MSRAQELTHSAIRLPLDTNGNPRYYFPRFLFPAMSDKTRLRAGLNRYRGKAYGPGYVVQSYSLEADLQFALDTIGNATSADADNPTQTAWLKAYANGH